MGDAKITDLAAAAALDGTEVFPCDQGAATKAATAAQIKTMVRRAGSGTAGSWPVMGASASLLSAPVAGAEEFDGTCRYFSPADGSRAVVLAEYVAVTPAANYTLTSTTNAQKLFNIGSAGALTLPAGTYFFESLLSLGSMDAAATSNAQFDIKGGGNATLGTAMYHATGVDGATATAASQTGTLATGSASAAAIVTAVANANMNVSIRGVFRVTVGGTIIPSIKLAVAAAAVVRGGSYFRCRCMGGAAAAYCGPWS